MTNTATFRECESCSSLNVARVNTEICLHFPGLRGLNKDPIFVLAKVAVCLDCGLLQGELSETDLERIRQPRLQAAAGAF